MTERERKQIILAIDDRARACAIVVVDTLAQAESIARDLNATGTLRTIVVADGTTLDLVSFVSTLARHAH